MYVVAMQIGRFTDRGFLIGPYLPIFGIGAVFKPPGDIVFKSRVIIGILGGSNEAGA